MRQEKKELGYSMTKEQMTHRLRQWDPRADIQVVDLTGTSDHWEVSVASHLFAGLTRIEQHQKVMSCFNDELKTGEVHALSIKTRTKED